MNSNSLSSGPASIPDFAPLTDAFDMTPTPSEADAMSVRATVNMEVKANAIKKTKTRPQFFHLIGRPRQDFDGDWKQRTDFYLVGAKPDKDGSHSQDCQISKLKNSLKDVVENIKKQIAPWGRKAAQEVLFEWSQHRMSVTL